MLCLFFIIVELCVNTRSRGILVKFMLERMSSMKQERVSAYDGPDPSREVCCRCFSRCYQSTQRTDCPNCR